MLKIVHLSSVHPVYDTRILHKECKTLIEAGYQVIFIAPHDQDEVLNEVTIRAVSRPQGRFERFTRTIRLIYKAALKEGGDVYHLHDPELLPIGILLKLHNKRVIYDVHEDVSLQILNKKWIPKGLRKIISILVHVIESVIAKLMDGIITATPAIATKFPIETTTVVQNFPVVSELPPNSSEYSERENLIAYTGSISLVQGIKEIVSAINLIPKSFNAKLLLAGRFAYPELQDKLSKMPGWEKVEFLGWQNREGVSNILGRAKVALVTDHPIPNYLEGYSTKMFEYMLASVPLVASDFPLWREIIENPKCGLLVDPLNPQEIATAITTLLANSEEANKMGEQGKNEIYKNYNWGLQAEKLLALYKRVSMG